LIIEDGVEIWRARSSIKKCYRGDLDEFDKLYEQIFQEQVEKFNNDEEGIPDDKEYVPELVDTQTSEVAFSKEDFSSNRSITEEDSQ